MALQGGNTQLPLRRAGVERAQVPALQGPSAFVDLSTFASGIMNMSRAVMIRQRTNAVNRGKNHAYQLERAMTPGLHKFIQAHAGEDTFPTDFEAFMAEHAQEKGAGITFNNDTERQAFELAYNQYAHRTLVSALQLDNQKYFENQNAILQNNISRATLGSQYQTPEQLQHTYYELAEVLREASMDTEARPGIISPAIAGTTFHDQARTIATGNLTERAKHDPSLMLAIEEGKQTVQMPVLDAQMNLVGFEETLLSAEEVNGIRAQLNTYISQTKANEKGVSDIQAQRLDFTKRTMANEAYRAILDGESGRADEMARAYIPEFGPLFSTEEIATTKRFEDFMRKAQTEGYTSDTGLFMSMIRKADAGDLTMTEFLGHDTTDRLSYSDRQDIMRTHLRAQHRLLEEGGTVYNRRKAQARSILEKQFGVITPLLGDREAAGFLADIMVAFEDRTSRAEDEQRALGRSYAELNPLQLAQQLIRERQDAFFSVLAPEANNLGKALVRYYNQVQQMNLPSPSIQDVQRRLSSDFQDGRIGVVEYERQLFLINALRKQGVTYHRLGEMVQAGTGIDFRPSSTLQGDPENPDSHARTRLNVFAEWLWDTMTEGFDTTTGPGITDKLENED